MPSVAVTDIRIVLAPARLATTGLLAWAEATVGPVAVHGLAVRLTRSDRLVVTWPARRDGEGRGVPTVTVADVVLRCRVEAAVIAAYARTTRRPA